uniref:Type I-C CRISPR-associated protein Cas8c/Csd1 n=1 Tax=candidate division WOR-3 bacterium TaxID=2052148 RepID=A0A7C4CEI1_UNCW3
MLELLTRRAAEATPGFAAKQIRWVIAFSGQGVFLGVTELGEVGQRRNRGQTFSLCPEFSRQFKQRGGKSEFLWDAAKVVTLHSDDLDDEKLKASHQHFVALLQDASRAVPELATVARALSDDSVLKQVRERMQAEGVKPNDRVTLSIDGRFPLESGDWHDWWRETYQASIGAGAGGRKMVCFATGSVVEPLDKHPEIEGLAGVGGQGMGGVLVGMNKDAFQSYFLERSTNAAVSLEAAYRYRAALNELIRDNSQKLAGALVVHWFKHTVAPEDDPLAWLTAGGDEAELTARNRASELLQSIRDGRRTDLAGNYYYALTLSGAGGRVMVRDWMEGQFEELASNITCWFEDLAIVHQKGGRIAQDPKFMAVLGATVRELRDLPPPFVAKMWRVAVRGEPIPQAALAQAFVRVKVGIISHERFDHARMGLLKAYFVRQDRIRGQEESDMKPHLNEEHPSAAYHCGRLMAVLAKLQKAALGDVGASVVQRYYAAASATPALVLGRLVRGAQFHLNKLEGGLAHWFEDKLGEVASRLGSSVPQTLTLEEQSLFALGYYQQLVDMKTKKSGEKLEA